MFPYWIFTSSTSLLCLLLFSFVTTHFKFVVKLLEHALLLWLFLAKLLEDIDNSLHSQGLSGSTEACCSQMIKNRKQIYLLFPVPTVCEFQPHTPTAPRWLVNDHIWFSGPWSQLGAFCVLEPVPTNHKHIGSIKWSRYISIGVCS